MAFGVRGDGEVVFNATNNIEDDGAADAEQREVVFAGNCKDHRGVGFVGGVFMLGEPAGNLAKVEVGVGLLSGRGNA